MQPLCDLKYCEIEISPFMWRLKLWKAIRDHVGELSIVVPRSIYIVGGIGEEKSTWNFINELQSGVVYHNTFSDIDELVKIIDLESSQEVHYALIKPNFLEFKSVTLNKTFIHTPERYFVKSKHIENEVEEIDDFFGYLRDNTVFVQPAMIGELLYYPFTPEE